MLQIFNYNQSQVSFQHEDGTVMVNATEMAKPFGKRPNDWMALNSAKTFLHELSITRNSGNWISTERGQHSGGTWMHEDVALEFARWLSPAFAIWCNDRIKELMRHGMTATPAKLEELIANPELVIGLAQKLKEERAEKERLQDQVDRDAPKVLFADSVSASQSTILIGELAKIIKQNGVDMGQNRLFEWMRNNGYLIRRKGTDYNMPTQSSMNSGLFFIKETSITHSDGHISVNKTVKVTGKGQQFFINIFLKSIAA